MLLIRRSDIKFVIDSLDAGVIEVREVAAICNRLEDALLHEEGRILGDERGIRETLSYLAEANLPEYTGASDNVSLAKRAKEILTDT